MIKNDKQPEEGKVVAPPFPPKAFWAFMALLLYKTGGKEVITQELIDKFDIDQGPEVLYDHENKAWIMKLPDGTMPTIVTVPKKMLKRNRKLILS